MLRPLRMMKLRWGMCARAPPPGTPPPPPGAHACNARPSTLTPHPASPARPRPPRHRPTATQAVLERGGCRPRGPAAGSLRLHRLGAVHPRAMPQRLAARPAGLTPAGPGGGWRRRGGGGRGAWAGRGWLAAGDHGAADGQTTCRMAEEPLHDMGASRSRPPPHTHPPHPPPPPRSASCASSPTGACPPPAAAPAGPWCPASPSAWPAWSPPTSRPAAGPCSCCGCGAATCWCRGQSRPPSWA